MIDKKFWDIKAKKYPKPFDENFRSYINIIKKIKDFGISFKNKRIIDIGCGTGNYSLILAKEAKEVFCLDFSDEMIKVLEKEVIKRNIKNVLCQISSFQNFDIRKYKKHFDISFASMTPAVKNTNDVLKMEKLAKEYSIFIGWAGKRENKIADEILFMHKIKPYHPKGFFDIKKILEKRRKKFKQKIFESSWDWIGTISEAIEDFSARIKLDGKVPDRKLMFKVLSEKFPSDKVKMTTFASQGFLIWKP